MGHFEHLKKPAYLWWWLWLLVGLACTVYLLLGRCSAERNDRAVDVVMSGEDVAFLAEHSGTAAERWAELLGDYQSFAFEEGELPLALVENHDRDSMHMPEGFVPESYEGAMVKTLYLYDDYANRATATEADEIENLLFRAVTDRGMRLLILRPFYTAEGTPVTDIAVYQRCLDGLAKRLEARGYHFGEGFSCMESAVNQTWLLRGAAMFPVALGCLWLSLLLRRETLLYLFSTVGLAALLVYPALLPLKLLMLGTALVFPCVAAWALAEYLQRPFQRPWWQSMGLVMGALLGWSLLGGGCVAALMSGREYVMGVSIFAGVKLSLLLPMVFAGGYLLWTLRQKLLGAGWKSWGGLLAAAAVFGGLYLLLTLRSGDASISALETSLRNFMEHTLYARPRSKELFFAAPCVPVFVWACHRKRPLLQLVGGIGACLECVSVINTFCHAVAPLRVSLIRSLLAAGPGLLLGLLAVAVLELWQRKKS